MIFIVYASKMKNEFLVFKNKSKSQNTPNMVFRVWIFLTPNVLFVCFCPKEDNQYLNSRESLDDSRQKCYINKNTFCVFQIPCKTPKTIVSVWWTNAKGQTSQFCLQGAKPWKSFLLVHSFNDLHCICLKTDKLKGLDYKALRKPFDMCDIILGPPPREKCRA